MRKNIRYGTLGGLLLAFLLAITACSNANEGHSITESQVSVPGMSDLHEILSEERKSVGRDDDSQLVDNSDQSSGKYIENQKKKIKTNVSFSYKDIPKYRGEPYADINDGIPYFTNDDITTESFESYSKLDKLGRCGTAFACVGTDTMSTEERGKIGMIKPSGWHTVKYPGVVDGLYVYNRCHLIAYCLTAENANEKNLITGTRSMNVDGMLPFETKVAQYIENTENHVLYRVTPIFVKDELVCRGVLMEAYSVEDNGEGIQFCVFCYNAQDGVNIDYASGETSLKENPNSNASKTGQDGSENLVKHYVLNVNTKKFHDSTCESVAQISIHNRKEVTEDREVLIQEGYSPCKICNP